MIEGRLDMEKEKNIRNIMNNIREANVTKEHMKGRKKITQEKIIKI